MRTRDERIKNNWKKALRKARICANHHDSWYDNLHQYSKNKIHCSCYLCSCKTRQKGKRDYWKPADLRRLMTFDYPLEVFYRPELEEDFWEDAVVEGVTFEGIPLDGKYIDYLFS